MSDSDDDSVEISDVDVSDDEESDAPSTVPSDDGQEEKYPIGDEEEEEEEGDELAPLEDDMMDRDEYYDDDDDEDYSDEEAEDGDNAVLLAQHEEKFFERLNHFMDVQRKIEERMQKIDPNDRLKEIEITTHSGGILEEDGTFKLKYQQQDAEGEPAQNLGEVYEAAYQIKQSLRDLLDAMVDKVKGLDYVDAKIVELKPRDRANEKAREEYLTRTPGPPETWLYDILRASVTCKTMKQMESVNKFLVKKAHIVQAKNRFVTPAYSGYRDLIYHVLLKWPYKENVHFVAEIQVHHKDVLNLEKLFGLQNHYKYFRPIFAGESRSVAETMRDLEQMQKHKKIDDSLIQIMLDSNDPDQLFMYAKLFYLKLENYDVALHMYSRVLALQEASIGEIHAKTSATYQDVGLVQAKMGDYDNALRSLQKCLEIQEQVFGPYSPEVAITRSHLGHTIVERGDDGDELMEHRGALQQYRKALVIREKCLGEDHLDVAGSYQNIGESLCKLGDFQGALAAYRESLSILESLLGENHADVASGHSLLGDVLYQQGDFQGAMEEYSIALAIREEVFGKTHHTTAYSHSEIGRLLAEVQDYDEAESRHRKALRIRETVVGKESPQAAESHWWIGYVLNQKGDFAEALKEHKVGYSIRVKVLTKRHPDTKASLRSVRACENHQKEP
ncbi:expressed tetratricopeptide repeat protein [Nitzschia inconspicua]|uniref:Expressed tetratricopeptide repeat protein n=1 Tax=Nitzschia inconspicua TaxID=303405 RepID=A0A9K3PSP5_9STRA|nr:expressed tetratricopeptide repeat protein [Nitzschia inconspicua]